MLAASSILSGTMRKTMAAFVVVIIASQFWVSISIAMNDRWMDAPPPSSALNPHPSSALTSRKRPKIAIVSGFVPSNQTKTGGKFTKFDDLINKACYAHIWGYDFIFNMTDGFSDHPIEHRHWLTYGTWHRVPHVQAVLPYYDWVLYADTDYLIKDITRPLESFLHEFEFYGKSPDLFVPRDGEQHEDKGNGNGKNGQYAFSAFVFLIKSSPFSTRLLQHWMEFAAGLCPAGNFKSDKKKYFWTDSDQPGLWYSMIKTHMEFFPPRPAHQEISGSNTTTSASTPFHLKDPKDLYTCNATTGLIESDHHPRTFGPELNRYFNGIGAVMGSYGSHLNRVPDKQPIVWSRNAQDSRAGLGFQMEMEYGEYKNVGPWAFAIHKKKDWPLIMETELDICKTRHGCYARYNAADKLEIGCHNVSFQVVTK
jgi:hypothetical protein